MIDLQNVKKACFSGYRPKKFPFNLNNASVEFCLLQSRIEKTLTSLIEDDCLVFYSGMAEGFDILCAECVLRLKEKFPDVSLVCALPFENQERAFSSDWRYRYYNVLQKADEINYVSKEYYSWCFQNRNKYMVDNSDFVVCWYDGKSGGTQNTIKYARKLRRCIINVNIDYDVELNDIQTKINLL